ncbi:MAG: hypothetical protein AAF479_17880 [Pseudomonadota bacterium]
MSHLFGSRALSDRQGGRFEAVCLETFVAMDSSPLENSRVLPLTFLEANISGRIRLPTIPNEKCVPGEWLGIVEQLTDPFLLSISNVFGCLVDAGRGLEWDLFFGFAVLAAKLLRNDEELLGYELSGHPGLPFVHQSHRMLAERGEKFAEQKACGTKTIS